MWETLFKDFEFFPEAASTLAWEIDAIYLFAVALTVFFTALIFAVMVLFIVRYRRKSDDEVPAPIHGSVPLEIFWSVVPFIITMVLFGWGAYVFFKIVRPPANAMDVYVVGKQWMWKIQHPEGKREINELHVPVNQPVRLIMTSEDVLHSFYIPAFRIKRDTVPGRYATLWFEADKIGEYHLFCAEFCGNEHSRMIGRVVVMSPDDYDAWLQTERGETPAEAGERLFSELRCEGCHMNGDGTAPSLDGLYGSQVLLTDGARVTADESYIRESILDPSHRVVSGFRPAMPTFQGQVTEEQVLELIAYIKTLRVD
jgi:cytochrome c oxidase subunit II